MNIYGNNIVITNCTNLPLCFHVGITCLYNGEMCVFHNTPSKTNGYGGNVICEPLYKFLSDRKINAIYPTNIPTEKILQNFNQIKNKKYNALNFNCESYINQLINGNTGTTQLEKLFCASVLCGSLFL